MLARQNRCDRRCLPLMARLQDAAAEPLPKGWVTACGQRVAVVRPDFDWAKKHLHKTDRVFTGSVQKLLEMTAYRSAESGGFSIQAPKPPGHKKRKGTQAQASDQQNKPHGCPPAPYRSQQLDARERQIKPEPRGMHDVHNPVARAISLGWLWRHESGT
jgi:hypothetical protein